VRGRNVFGALLLPGACAALLVSGCGGGTRQDAREPEHVYKIRVTDLTFPPKQAISRPTFMRIKVVNADTKTIPNIGVTIDSFYYTSTYPELAANRRPIWVVEQGPGPNPSRPAQSQAISPPGGGQTAYVNTWALGPLAPGKTATFLWKVVPVKAGTHRLHLLVVPSLGGKAKATLPNGGLLAATMQAHIAAAPAARHVNPNTGRVTPGAYPTTP
jgi:hypothetical protein